MSQRPSEWNKIRWIQIYILESTVYRGGKNVEIPNGCDIKHLWRIESECTIVSAIIKIYSNCSSNMIIYFMKYI